MEKVYIKRTPHGCRARSFVCSRPSFVYYQHLIPVMSKSWSVFYEIHICLVSHRSSVVLVQRPLLIKIMVSLLWDLHTSHFARIVDRLVQRPLLIKIMVGLLWDLHMSCLAWIVGRFGYGIDVSHSPGFSFVPTVQVLYYLFTYCTYLSSLPYLFGFRLSSVSDVSVWVFISDLLSP